MFEQTNVREGMVVRSQDGEKLGKVFAVGEGQFHIEKGLFFPKDYVCRYSDIADIRDGEIILAHGKESLSKLSADDRYGYTAGVGGGAGVGPGAVGASSLGLGTSGLDTGLNASANLERDRLDTRTVTGDVVIPVAREELDVVKRDVAAGEVRIHKDVVAEEQVIDVPVRRERARVERRAVDPGRPAMSASFQEETVVVPLRGEQVDVTKRALVDEEVVIHKDAVIEEERVSETVRSERVDIRSDGSVDTNRKLNFSDDDPKRRY